MARANIKSLSGESVSAFNNPALAIDSGLSAAVFINNQYALQELSSIGAFVRKNVGNGQFSGGTSVFGNSNYQERRVNVGYGLQVQENLRFGVAINAWHFAFREKEANHTVLAFSPGLSYRYKQLDIGFYAQNLELGSATSAYVQEALALGATYNLSNVALSAELEKYSNRKLLTKVALDYKLKPNISLLYAVSFGEFNQHAGIGFFLKSIRIDLAFFYQNRVGASSAITGTYKQ